MTMEIQRMVQRIGAVRDTFHDALFTARDVGAALAALDDDAVVETVPQVAGARGADLRRFLTEDVLGHLPDDLRFHRESRTADQRRVADEMSVSFTHDRELPWLLPGIPPTHRSATVRAMSVVSFKHTSRSGETTSRILAYRLHWDRLDLVARLGVSPEPSAAAG